MDENEFKMRDGDENWRDTVGDEKILLADGLVATAREVYFAVEKLTPFLQETENRYPTEEDITIFVMILRGP